MKKINSIIVVASICAGLFFSPAYLTAERSFPFSITLSGNYGFINGNDVNRIISEKSSQFSGPTAFFNWEELKNTNDINFEVIYHLSESIGIGIGAGYLFKTNSGEYGWRADSNVYSDQFREYKISAFLLNGNVHYNFNLSNTLNLYATAGGDIYFGKLKHLHEISWDYHLSQSNPYWYVPISDPTIGPIYYSGDEDIHVVGSSEMNEDMSSTTVGFHAGLGLELKLNTTFSVIAGGFYRFARFSDITGEQNYSNTLGDSSGINGTLWYWEKEINDIKIWSTQPEDSRKAEIDLSGFNIQIGVKIKFSLSLF